MPYNRNQARPLLTETEYELFVSSLREHVTELDKGGLKKAITRARRARDKYRDLAKRQNIATTRRAGARAAAHTANDRTQAKTAIFAETLGRLEQRLEKLEANEARATRQARLQRAATTRGAAPAANRATRRSRARGAAATGTFMSEQASAANQSAIRAPQTRIVASRAAAGRRRQAKRDR